MTKHIEEWEKAQKAKPFSEMKMLTAALQEKFQGTHICTKFEDDGVAVNRNLEDAGGAILAMFGGTMSMVIQCMIDEEVELKALEMLRDMMGGTAKALDDIIKHSDEITLKESEREPQEPDFDGLKDFLGKLPADAQERIARDLIAKMFGQE